MGIREKSGRPIFVKKRCYSPVLEHGRHSLSARSCSACKEKAERNRVSMNPLLLSHKNLKKESEDPSLSLKRKFKAKKIEKEM